MERLRDYNGEHKLRQQWIGRLTDLGWRASIKFIFILFFIFISFEHSANKIRDSTDGHSGQDVGVRTVTRLSAET